MPIIFKRTFVILTLIFTTPFALYAQVTDNVIGKKLTIESKILEDSREIQLHFPESYSTSDKRYPVLYMLDGQRLHTLGVSLSQTLTGDQKMVPEFIVVSVENKYPDRFSLLTKPEYLDFIEQEVVAFIDKTYRTTDERIAFGWEFAGALVVQSLISKPDLFSGHVATSPYPLGETWFAEKTRVEQVKDHLNTNVNSHLYFTVSEYEGPVNIGTDKLNTVLAESAPKSLRWTYRTITEERHLSTPYASLFQGLMDYFYGYETFYIEGLEQFENAGGLENFYQYNKLRAERYGFSEKPEPWSIYTIIRNAIRADDFEKFDRFVKEFEQTDMFSTIRLSRTLPFADYYQEKNKLDRAIETLKKIALAHPANAKVQHKLGSGYLELDNKTLAKEHFVKAVEFAEASEDKQLEEYRKQLAELEKS